MGNTCLLVEVFRNPSVQGTGYQQQERLQNVYGHEEVGRRHQRSRMLGARFTPRD